MRLRGDFSRRAGYLALGMILLAVASGYMNYSTTIYQADRAMAWLNRAETAAFAEEMIAYIGEGRNLLPRSGNPVWWFPTQRTDFTLIQSDIDKIIERALIIRALPRDSPAYQQGMDDLREKLRTIEDQIGEAAPFMFSSQTSIILSVIWLIVETYLMAAYFRGKRPTQIKIES